MSIVKRQMMMRMNVEMFSVAEIELTAVLLPYVYDTHSTFVLFCLFLKRIARDRIRGGNDGCNSHNQQIP